MKNRKPIKSVAIELFISLEKKEIKEFSTWLSSPWCNSNKQLLPIFHFLRDHYHSTSVDELTKQQLFAAVYPNKSYNDKVFRNLLGHFSVQLRQFLLVKRFIGNPRLFQQLLLVEYMQRGKSDWFIRESQKKLKEIEHSPVKTWEDMLDELLINEQLYFSPYTIFRQQKKAVPLQQAKLALDDFYFLGKFRFLNEEIERQKKFTQKIETDKVVQDLPWLGAEDRERIARNPLINIYYERILNQTLSFEEQFEKANETFRATANLLPIKDQQILFLYLLNDATRLSQIGNIEILPKTLDLYQFGISRTLIYHNEKITESTFLNIVSLAAGLKEFEFLDDFLSTHLSKLPLSSKEEAALWATAKIFLENENHNKCIELLNQYVFKNFVFVYRARFLMLQAYFEKFLEDDSYYPFFKSLCKREETNMRNEKRLSISRKQAVVKFIQYLRKIAKWKDNVNSSIKGLYQLEAKLAIETNIQGKHWLKAKINQLRVEQ